MPLLPWRSSPAALVSSPSSAGGPWQPPAAASATRPPVPGGGPVTDGLLAGALPRYAQGGDLLGTVPYGVEGVQRV